MKGLRNHVAAGLLLASIVPGTALAGSILYGVTFGGAAPLLEIDHATGQATSIVGDLVAVGDLTSNQSDTLWGVTLNGGNNLVTIDPATGNVVTSLALTGVNANTGGGFITSLAYNPVSGRLYGNTTPGFGDGLRGDDLYEIDPLTGTLSFIGVIDFDNVFALAFDQLGALFGITNDGDLISINAATGAGALIVNGLGAGLFDIASRPEDNTMFLSSAFSQTLSTIDTVTGIITPVGGYNNAAAFNVAGLAFLGEVPEPASVALLGAGLLAWRFRPRAASRHG